MDAVMGFFSSGIMGIVFLILAVGAIVVAYVLYRKGRRVKDPSWAIRSDNLIKEYTARLSDLSVLYKGDSVENLSISKVLFWNRGGDTINRGDIAPADLLRITGVGDVRLLDVRVAQVNSEAAHFSITLSEDQKSAYLGFDYLDKGKGAVIQVVHSGTSSEDVQVLGSIKGAGVPHKKDIKVVNFLPLPTSRAFDQRRKPATRRRIFALVSAIPLLVYLAFVIVLAVTADEPLEAFEWALLALFIGIAAIPAFFISVAYLWRGKPPTGLGEFEAEI